MHDGTRTAGSTNKEKTTTSAPPPLGDLVLAAVLVHGFGAFGDQWRFNLAPLAEAGFTVYAPTLPGFGRSEKAALQYSQNAW